MNMEQKLEEELKKSRKEKGMSNITATEYQNKAMETAIYPKNHVCCC